MQGPASFEEKLLPLLLTLLQDQVNAVRMSATGILGSLGAPDCLGPAWMRAKVLPHLGELYAAEGGSYLQRITVLYALRELLTASVAGSRGSSNTAGGDDGAASSSSSVSSVIAPDALPLLTSALRDEVPNVRFVAVQICEDASAALAPCRESLGPLIAELASKDGDSDVKFFASRALAKLHQQ